MKKKSKMIIAAIVALISVIITAIIVLIVIKQTSPKNFFYYMKKAELVNEIVMWEQYNKDGISKITLDATDSEYLIEHLKSCTYTKVDVKKDAELWDYKVMLMLEEKSVELLYYSCYGEDYCIVDGVVYSCVSGTETEMDEVWGKVTEDMSDYDWMMSYIGQLTDDTPNEQAHEIMGHHDYMWEFSMPVYHYKFGIYTVRVEYSDYSDTVYSVGYYNEETEEYQEIFSIDSKYYE